VRERGATDGRNDIRSKPCTPRGRFGELGNTRRMLAEPGRLEIGERSDRGESSRDSIAVHPYLRKRLTLEGLLPHPRLVEIREQLFEVANGELGELWVVRRARATLDDVASLFTAGCGQEERDVSRDVQETDWERQRIAADVREPASVPAREDELERGLDLRVEPQPACEALGHLAHRREPFARSRPGVGDRILDQRGAHVRRTPGADVRLVEREHLGRVRRIDEEERSSVRNVVVVHLNRLVPVRGAARGMEECGVVRVRELVG
jgi:hypothetical protein